MKLRSGAASDAEEIAALIASFHSEMTVDPNGVGAEQYFATVSANAERSYLTSEKYSYLVAEQDGLVVGFIALRDTSHIFHLFVARAYQRQGLAHELWATAKAQALRTASLGNFTVNSSLVAVPVYRAFGFAPAGEVTTAHGISFLPMRLVIENEI